MSEYPTDPNIDSLNAELFIQDATLTMQNLWKNARAPGERTLQYHYVDPAHHRIEIEFAVEENDTPDPKYAVITPTDEFKILVHRQTLHGTAWTNGTTPTMTGISKWSETVKCFVQATDNDIVTLGKILEQLDTNEVVGRHTHTQNKRAKAPKIGATIVSKMKKMLGL